MIFENHSLSPPLDQYIESIFHFKGFMPDHSIERVVPTGHIFIIFELDDIPRNTFDNDTLKPIKTFTQVWISGMHRNFISISTHQNSEMFVIQFKPFGAYPFFHFALEKLSEKVLPAQEVFGEEILLLRNEILNCETFQDKFSVAEKWLKGKFDPNLTPPQDLLSVLNFLQNEPCANYNCLVLK